eukprot:m.358214 g.358214  ORF g.358214 m.358214 type:complete len:322 (+) comp18071_c0_seq1:188-1153(+)
MAAVWDSVSSLFKTVWQSGEETLGAEGMVVVSTLALLPVYKVARFLLVRPGHDPPPPGSMYLAFGSRVKFEKCCDMKTDPYFFSLDTEVFQSKIESNWTVIRDELQRYLDKHDGSLQPFGHTHRMSKKHSWRLIALKLWSLTHPLASTEFPNTMALLNKTFSGDDEGRLVSVVISQMEAESDIAPHYGDTNANYRCHLGLRVPGTLPQVGFRCGDQEVSWLEGKLFAFNDAHYHRAWNGSPERRFILIIDVMRREHMSTRDHVCQYVLASFLLQRINNVFSFVTSTKRVEHAVHWFLYLALTLPVRLKVGSSIVHNWLGAK